MALAALSKAVSTSRQVGSFEGMPIPTVGTPRPPGPAGVLGSGDRLKMIWIDATAHAAKVIQIKVGRDFAAHALKDYPMRNDCAPLPSALGGIAVPVKSAEPYPAPRERDRHYLVFNSDRDH